MEESEESAHVGPSLFLELRGSVVLISVNIFQLLLFLFADWRDVFAGWWLRVNDVI